MPLAYYDQEISERIILTGGRAQRRKRQAARRRKERKLLILGIVGCLGLALLIGYISGGVKILKLKSDISQVKAEISQVESAISQLEQEKAEITSPQYVEQVAREKLGLVKPGEVRFVITPAGDGVKEQDVKVREDSYNAPLY